tara:strand:+ start:458 stop:1135 length:678 start_codon:yes stop_codon:yes gene_type:complete
MNWEDKGFILSKRKFRENAVLLSVFTKNHGRSVGIVYGGTSRKVKNYLQLGNEIFVINNSKNNNKIGYFKTEIIEAVSPKFFDNKIKSFCILSLTELLNSLLPEEQAYQNLYLSLENLIKSLDNKNWPIIYIFWELNLIKELGFGFKFEKSNSKKDVLSHTIDNITYDIPKFIINNELPDDISKKTINKSLTFTRNILLNKFYLPNNLFFPKSRIVLENFFFSNR